MEKLHKELLEVMQREPIVRSLMMRYPMQDPVWDAGLFLDLTKDPEKQTPPGLTDYIRHEIEAYCAAASGEDEDRLQAYLEGLNRIWPVLEAKMQKSYGLAEYMRTIGCRSLFLPLFYAEMPSATSMEAPYGMAKRLDGVFMPIPPSDPAYLLCGREPVFRTDVVRTAKQQLTQLELGDRANTVSLGSGTLPEYNHFAWQERGVKQNVIAYDNADGIAEALGWVYPKPLKEYGIDFRADNLWNSFKDPDLQGVQDLVGMEGGLSYYVDETDDLLQGVASLLRPGGYFCGEVELMHLYTVRCAILGWQMSKPMKPDADVESAIQRISAAAERAGLKVLEVYPDEWNAQPAAVWFKLQKI